MTDVILKRSEGLEEVLTSVAASERLLNEKRQGINQVLSEIVDLVKAFSKQVENTASDHRFAVTCQALERLERAKRALDEVMWSYLAMEESLICIRGRLLALEGEAAESKHCGDLRNRIREAAAQTDGSILDYRQRREYFERIARQLLPRFLEELYRLSDAERGGRGFRLSSVLILCGSFCNEIKYS